MKIDVVKSEMTFHFLPYIMTTKVMMADDGEVRDIIMFGWMFFGVVVFL